MLILPNTGNVDQRVKYLQPRKGEKVHAGRGLITSRRSGTEPPIPKINWSKYVEKLGLLNGEHNYAQTYKIAFPLPANRK